MSVLDLAASSRVSGTGYVTLRVLDAFPEYVDSDNYTRALAERKSDGAIVVVYARGAVQDIVSVQNERSRLTWERGSAAKLAADEELSQPERDAASLTVSACDEQLGTLPKTRAQATLHVARALTHYERVEEPISE